jgi:hypothetical protein
VEAGCGVTGVFGAATPGHSGFGIQSGIRVSALLRHSGFDLGQSIRAGQMTNDEEIPKPESPNE